MDHKTMTSLDILQTPYDTVRHGVPTIICPSAFTIGSQIQQRGPLSASHTFLTGLEYIRYPRLHTDILVCYFPQIC
jgi:hypothetical protein